MAVIVQLIACGFGGFPSRRVCRSVRSRPSRNSSSKSSKNLHTLRSKTRQNLRSSTWISLEQKNVNLSRTEPLALSNPTFQLRRLPRNLLRRDSCNRMTRHHLRALLLSLQQCPELDLADHRFGFYDGDGVVSGEDGLKVVGECGLE